MSKLKKSSTALAVAAVLSAGAQAGTMDIVSQGVATQLTTKSGGYSVVAASNALEAIKITAGSNYNSGDRITIKLSQGSFPAAAYSFVSATQTAPSTTDGSSTGSVSTALPVEMLDTGAAGTQSGDTITFRFVKEHNVAGQDFYLVSGAVSAARATTSATEKVVSGAEAVEIVVANAANNSKVELAYTVTDLGGTVDSATSKDDFANFADQYSGSVYDSANATIDVAADRLLFLNKASTATGAVKFSSSVDVKAAAASKIVDWTTSDDITITLSGDMTGIEKITGTLNGAMTGVGKKADFTIDGDSAELVIDGASIGAGSIDASSVGITFVVDESTQLEEVVYQVGAELNFKNYADEVVVDIAKSAGKLATWSVNGLNVAINHFSLNSGFVNWLKIANNGSLPADIEATFTYTNEDGSETTDSVLMAKKAEGNSVTTISEADLLEAMGLTAEDGLTDVSIELFVAAKAQDIQIHAEKKASNGRLSIPVRYDTTNEARKYR
jgi:hypothetical protein